MQHLLKPPLPKSQQQSLYWGNAAGSAQSLAVFEAASAADAPLLYLLPDNEAVEQALRELRYFARADTEMVILGLPDWETLPYDNFSPHQDIISERLRALYQLPGLRHGVLVVSMTSLMHRLPPAHYVAANSLNFAKGQSLDSDKLRAQLSLANYQAVDSVNEHGEFAVRGSIIDIFPMGSQLPYRLDLFDEDIDSIRTFDPETQRSLDEVDAIKLLPGREYPLDKSGINNFRARFRERFDVDLRQCPVYQDVGEGINSPGLEYYLPLFFDALSSLFDFLPEDAIICSRGELLASGERFWQDIEARFQDRQIDRFRPVLNPDEIFLRADALFRDIKAYRRIDFRDHEQAHSLGGNELPDLNANPRLQQPFTDLLKFIGERPERVLFCAETAGRRENLMEVLRQAELKPVETEYWQDFVTGDAALGITVAPLDQGLWISDPGLILITETQLFGNRVAQRRRRQRQQVNSELVIRNLTELHLDDAVVHVDHGVGRYRGLETITTEGEAAEFLTLEYAAGAKLYVPVSALHLISRYGGSEQEAAPLNTLGSDQWQKTKRKAAEKIRDAAAELLDIYARRQARKGHQFNVDRAEYDKFAASFPFEETPDQESAIQAVLDDMRSPRAMDRLVCGDVGFGKTEVAMRAAFVAVQNNRQVALLVPTTLLAQQHFDTFQDRFADWPLVIEVVSRFRSGKEQNATLERVAAGKVDILIGTHKLLHADINYKTLGLLIVDEEHRFGVRQKEKLKSLRANVDILNLTATPIPRTLNMALSGLRDLSLVVTPPAKRLSIKTFVREHQDGLIKEAISRELLRGGQVFYLHNEVKTIERAASHLKEIVPQARISVAHGQMAERDLEKVMADFYHKRYNILICTTIIETGIDIPSANTIIIDRADKFGLAQLHQLRGRVGRSHHQAYAYLLLPHSRLTGDAEKRIEAIRSASNLGAGFTLASHDLEIRGAGELLGEEQSGHLQKIGFTLYSDMLEEAVNAIKEGRTPSVDLSAEKSIDINLRIPALIPDDYLPDVHTRLIMYKRIASADDEKELKELQVEMIDRFGLLPRQLKLLMRLTSLRLRAQQFGIRRIDANVSQGRLEFAAETRVDPLSLVQLIQKDPTHFRLSGANQLHFTHNCEEAEARLEFINDLLDTMKLVQQQAA